LSFYIEKYEIQLRLCSLASLISAVLVTLHPGSLLFCYKFSYIYFGCFGVVVSVPWCI